MQMIATTTRRSTETTRTRVFPVGNLFPFVLVTILFFIWGLSNNLTDILVQQFKKSFELSPLQAQLVQTAVFLGYACMALPAALFMRRRGYKAGIVTGLCIFSVGTFLFWPAAAIGQYSPFLVALFVVGCGSATLETAANPFIAQFGPVETSEQRLNFAQSFNPPGTITGVIVGAYFILSGIENSPTRVLQMKAGGTYAAYLHMEIMRVVPTYVVISGIVLLFALLIGLTRFPAIHREHEDGGDHGRFSQLFRYSHLWVAVFAEFCYCGAQFATWSAYIFYMKQYTHVNERTAALFLTGNLIAMALGRFVSTWLMRWFDPARMMSLYAVINIVLLGYGIARPGFTGAMMILASSFFMSLMFPTIFAMGIKDLGPNTKLGGSLLVMSVAGGGVFPPVLGWVAKRTGSYALSYVVPLVAYIVVALYGYYGRRMKISDQQRHAVTASAQGHFTLCLSAAHTMLSSAIHQSIVRFGAIENPIVGETSAPNSVLSRALGEAEKLLAIDRPRIFLSLSLRPRKTLWFSPKRQESTRFVFPAKRFSKAVSYATLTSDGVSGH